MQKANAAKEEPAEEAGSADKDSTEDKKKGKTDKTNAEEGEVVKE
jgi:hypothetical protein